jgi:aerobic-type carbon monoxide dehydrogenase small subunit (CoxS/CutS family)
MSQEQTTRTLQVNGEVRHVAFPVHHSLLEVLREELGLTGTKHGCELGECGTCTVLIDGKPLLSCLELAAECEGREIETVEGMMRGNELHPLQSCSQTQRGRSFRPPAVPIASTQVAQPGPDKMFTTMQKAPER